MEFDLAHAIAVLERTPRALHSLLADLPAAWTDATDGGDTWSAFTVVGHLVHGERADWIPRARIILDQGENRTFTPFDRTAQFRESEGKSLHELLHEFSSLRAESLITLASWNLTDEQLSLTGVHPAFGAVTLRQLLATWVAHDLGHLLQISRTMARQYRDAVGPWRAYLSALNP